MRKPIVPIMTAVLVAAATQTVLAIPDVVVSTTGGVAFYGTVGTISAFSVSTTSCNIGNTQLPWFENTPQHPVIATNMYRLKGGRFEQIGMNWVKHGWCAADGSTCTAAGGPPSCSSNPSCDWLGVGCTDTYSTGHNAAQLDLGPRSEVNASTGVFPYPFGLGWNQSGNAVYKRLQVLTTDVHPNDNPGALFCVDAHYVAASDAVPAGGNPFNNASYRTLTINSSLTPTVTGTTAPHKPGIEYWKVVDPGVNLSTVTIQGDGKYWLGSRAYNNGNGTHTYEYALFNLNSHRSAGSFSIEVGGATITDIGFHDVFYHSGEPYDGTDWTGVVSGCNITWATTPYEVNVNANALRWSTLYNFRFTSNSPPAPGLGRATVGFFRPGVDPTFSIDAIVPAVALGCGTCPGDVDGNGGLDGFDIGAFTAQYIGASPANSCAMELAAPSCSLDAADMNALVSLLLQAAPPCP